MKILIVVTNEYSEENYKKFLSIIEDTGNNFAGFISVYENEICNLQILDKKYTMYPAKYIPQLEYDKILIADKIQSTATNIYHKLLNFEIPSEKIEEIFWLIKEFMTAKYEDCNDNIILETLNYWKTHEINVFNQHLANVADSFSEVFIDKSCDLPYIVIESITGKKHKIYYPKDGAGSFYNINGKNYVVNIFREQLPTSPHLYMKDSHKIDEGDILIDAGVCEGNFALRNIDICSKVYLFEPDPKWEKPLWYTFKDFEQEIIMFPNFLSGVTEGNSITLDDAIPELNGEKIFLKMDIEGAEPAALRGGKNLLTNNKVKISACSYHNSNDIVKIKSILKNYGYKTQTSNGHMVFLYDPNIWDTMDFRKGVVYAENY